MAHMLEAQWFGRAPVRRGDPTGHAFVDDPLDAVRGIAFATLGSFVLFWLPLAAWIAI